MKPTIEFINKLADLLEEYHVDLCADPTESGCAKVSFIKFNVDEGGELVSEERFTNGRSHSTGYEFRVRAHSMARDATIWKA